MRRRTACVATLCAFVFLLFAPGTGSAATTQSPQSYIEYVKAYGDTYDGVTTDDGDHLGSSFAARVQVFYRRFAALYLFHRDETASLTNAHTSSGGPGTTLNYPGEQVIVPVFTAVNSASEFRLEYQPGRMPLYVGLASSNSFNNYGFPRLTGLGVGVEVQPDWHSGLSPYGSYFFFPNLTGTYPFAAPSDPSSGSAGSAFQGHEFVLGGSLQIPKADLSCVFGVYRTVDLRHTGTFNFVRDGPFIGFGYRVK